jgi:hypothetical protein
VRELERELERGGGCYIRKLVAKIQHSMLFKSPLLKNWG